MIHPCALWHCIRECLRKPLVLIIKGKKMVTVQTGQTAPFVVHCDNSAGQGVPDTNGPITVSVDVPAVGTATCNPDGTGGVFTALAAGSCNIVATDGKLTSAPYPVTVEDLTPASLTIAAS